MGTNKGPAWFAVVCILLGLLTGAGAAWAACPGGDFHTSTTDVTVGSETDYPSFLAIKISGANPVSSGTCFGTVEPSWSFNLQIYNTSDTTARRTDIQFNNLVIKYYDSGGTYLGSTTLSQADWLTYFDGGNFAGGTFSVPYLLEPGEFCAGCFCAHLGSKVSGYLKLVANYELPDSPDGFPHSIEIPIPPEVIEATRNGKPMVVPLRSDGTLVYKEVIPQDEGGYHPLAGTVTSVERPDQIANQNVNVPESNVDQYTISGMPANGTNLSATVGSADALTLSLEEDGVEICNDSGTTTLNCSKASPDPSKNYVFKLTGGAGGGSGNLTIDWDIPSVACGGGSNVNFLAENDYYFSTNPGGTVDLLHIRAVGVSAGADISVGIYSSYPYNQTAECTGNSGGAGASESCSEANAANQIWYSRILAVTNGSTSFYVECHNKSGATALTAGDPLSEGVQERSWDFYKLSVPSGQELVTASLKPVASGEDDNLYIKYGSLPQPDDYDGYRQGGGAGSLEQVMALNPSAGTWYLGVFCQTYIGDGFEVIMDYFDQDTTPTLTDGVSQSVTVENNEWVFRKIDVPSTADGVDFTVDNVPVGKSVKLYTMQGHFPTIQPGKNYCNTTASSDSAGECKHPPNTFATGTWYVGIFGSGLDGSSSISVDVRADISLPPDSISNGETKAFSVTSGQWQYYAASPGSSYDYMKARAHNVTNNPDLYVKKGAKPTTSSYDQRSTNSASNDESLLIGQIANDTYDFGLYGNYAGTSSGNLTVSWGNGTALGPGDERTVNLDNQDYAIYKIGVPAGTTQLGVSQTVSSGDMDLYTYKSNIDTSPDCSSANAGTTTESCDHANPNTGTWFVVSKGVSGTGSSSSGKLITVFYGTTGKLTGKINLAP